MRPRRCLETRQRLGYVYRAYSDGSKTYEFPVSVVKSFGAAAFKAALATHERGKQRASLATQRREHVAANPNHSVVSLAEFLGVSDARIRQYRKELQHEK